MSKQPAVVYQLKIQLRDIRPPIWRRVQVKDCTLAKLHNIIQVCLDWTNSHLHDFEVGEERYGEPDPEGMMEYDADERRVKLSQLVARGIKKFVYVYDFGDHWTHVLQIEKVLPAESGVSYPRCMTGKRAGPPEDCGGPWGYTDLLSILRDPAHASHEEMSDWVPEGFDPETFDLALINEELQALH
jgi:hypothetical protein